MRAASSTPSLSSLVHTGVLAAAGVTTLTRTPDSATSSARPRKTSRSPGHALPPSAMKPLVASMRTRGSLPRGHTGRAAVPEPVVGEGLLLRGERARPQAAATSGRRVRREGRRGGRPGRGGRGSVPGWAGGVPDQYSGFNHIVIPGTRRDSLYLLDGILDQPTSLDPTEIATDTAGASEMIFGLFRLLGYQSSPRLADAGHTLLHRADPAADYGPLNPLTTGLLTRYAASA
ncbi:hypothetical protein FCI23_48825 [Actinacidiphila oryziradicis]|uniref:Tn3 transposase DDE domain-containing protein n=1 Tax=Actinacidiphila oryziradicis TaxID=2571141 RepID=A0A4U0RRC9_9ACTN|nr:hypothetical protein FCI23_48825 [Actinacidiphila oryziradicis]